MKQLFTYIGEALKADTQESAKRLSGFIGWICAIVGIFIWQKELIDELMYTSAGMVGFDAVVELVKHFKRKK